VEQIEQAVKILNNGGIIIFPTDTAFGIGCRSDNETAVCRLFRIRKRPEIKPTPVLVSSIEMAQKYLLPVPDAVKTKLIKKYWPGALTLILRCVEKKVPGLVRGGGDTLGVRMPDHVIALSLINGVRVPILGPSANFHGGKTPFTLDDLDKDLVNQVDYVVKGECGVKQVSTIIDCTREPWQILREGAIRIEN